VDKVVNTRYQFSAEKAATQLKTAINAKAAQYPREQKAHLVLAVDVIETPGHAFEEIISGLDRKWAASLGFKAIWLVGVTPELCVRLYPEQLLPDCAFEWTGGDPGAAEQETEHTRHAQPLP
jgi:hypothetical protein